MEVDIVAALIGLAGGIIAALVSYIAVREKTAREQAAVLERLREQLRTEHRQELEKIHKEIAFKLRGSMYREQIEAHKKVWTVLRLAAYHAPGEEMVIVRREDGVFLNRPVAREIFARFQEMYYSELGLFVAKPTREAVFTIRDFVYDLLNQTEKQPGDLVMISNTKAKKVEEGFDWLRKNIRRDIGLEDLEMPQEARRGSEDTPD